MKRTKNLFIRHIQSIPECDDDDDDINDDEA